MRHILHAVLLTGIVAVTGASQFHLVERTATDGGTQPPMPREVRSVLERSCYDCHSNQTKWPWYSYIAPLSWLVEHDVREGRRDLDLTNWGKYDEDEQRDRIEEIATEVDDAHMPPAQYTLLHPEAVLSSEERALIRQWVDSWNTTMTAFNPETTIHRR